MKLASTKSQLLTALRAPLPWTLLAAGLVFNFGLWWAIRDGDRDIAGAVFLAGVFACAMLFSVGIMLALVRRQAAAGAAELRSAYGRSEQRLDGIIRGAMDAVIAVDAAQNIVIFNPAAERIFGYAASEVIGQELGRLIPARVTERHRQHVMNFGRTGTSTRSMGGDLAIWGLRRDGSEFPIDASISRSGEGEHVLYTVILRDITRRRAADAALRASRQFNAEVMDGMSEALVVYDRDLRVAAWNRVMTDLTGVAREAAMGRHLYELFPDLRAHDRAADLRRVLAGDTSIGERLHARRRGSCEFVAPDEVPRSAPDIAWTRSSFAPHRDHEGNITGVIVIGSDVTELQRNQARIADATERLRQLSTHLESTRESERARVAREIHDELAATLSGIKMDLSAARESLRGNPAKLDARLVASLKLIDSAVVATRRIINDLRPSILDNLGVWAAIEWQTNDTTKRAGIDCEVSIAEGLDNIPLTPALSTALFRIVQESLNNIRHHARANKAQVRCRCEGNDLAVEVRDDGVGFDLDDAGHAGHWGLIGMHERALAHGGMLEMSSARGAGTRVCVRFPLPRGQ